MEPIEIVYATNEKYLPILGVSIYSLIKHAHEKHHYRISILVENLSKKSQDKICNMQTENVEIRFIDVGAWIGTYKYRPVGHISRETIYRFLVDEIFSVESKILYIDVDTIICNDVAKLYHADIGDSILGVVRSRLVRNVARYLQEQLQFPLVDYFNAGVLLINVKAFHKAQIRERALRMMSERRYMLMDQDVLNILCHHQVIYLDGRWNVEWGHLCYPEFGVVEDEARKGMLEYVNDPYILHYTTAKKPWNYPEYPLADLWWAAARASGFAQEAAEQTRCQLALPTQFGVFDRFVFPWHLVHPEEHIYIYGGGEVGRAFCRQLEMTQYAEVIAVIDRSPADVHGVDAQIVSFDGWRASKMWHGEPVVIAIEKESIAEKIRESLREMGIPEEKIVWAAPGRKA